MQIFLGVCGFFPLAFCICLSRGEKSEALDIRIPRERLNSSWRDCLKGLIAKVFVPDLALSDSVVGLFAGRTRGW